MIIPYTKDQKIISEFKKQCVSSQSGCIYDFITAAELFYKTKPFIREKNIIDLTTEVVYNYRSGI